MKFSTQVIHLTISCLATLNAIVPAASAFTSTTSDFTSSCFRTSSDTIQANLRVNTQKQHSIKMSSLLDDDIEEDPLSDELSRLIGKRASISKSPSKTSDTSSSSSLESLINNDKNAVIDPSFEALYEGKSGMDMFEMPDFKAKRPLKTPKETDDKARGGSKSGKDEDDSYLDFFEDYDDENDLHIPNRMGFSTVAWGDVDQGFKAGKKLKKKEIKAGKFLAGDLQVAYDKLMEAGITLIDTSESYGIKSREKKLSAEEIISKCMDANTHSLPILATTMVSPLNCVRRGMGFRYGQSAILKAIKGSADRLGTGAIDMYQVPSRMFYLGAPGVVADALCDSMDNGLINNIGVCNMSKSSMRRFNAKLNKRGGYQLTSNSFEFSLVNRKAWKSGLINACKQEGIIPIARNPLGDGLASGVYTATNPTGGEVSKKQPFEFKTLDKYTTLHDVLATVQKKVQERLETQNSEMMDRRNRYKGPPINTEVTTTQVAINYIVAKGCVPAPSVKNPKEADEIIGCLTWNLTDEEVKLLDNAADMSDKGQIV